MVKVRSKRTEFVIKSLFVTDRLGMLLECLRGIGEGLDERGQGKGGKEATFNWMKWNEYQHFR